jgi:hypothetical protein
VWFATDRAARPAAPAGDAFLAIHALIHPWDAAAGREHMLVDLPTVFLPPALAIWIARSPPSLAHTQETRHNQMASKPLDHKIRAHVELWRHDAAAIVLEGQGVDRGDIRGRRPREKWTHLFNSALAILIVANVSGIVLEPVESIRRQFSVQLETFEHFARAVFAAEYLLRVWAAPRRLRVCPRCGEPLPAASAH